MGQLEDVMSLTGDRCNLKQTAQGSLLADLTKADESIAIAQKSTAHEKKFAGHSQQRGSGHAPHQHVQQGGAD